MYIVFNLKVFVLLLGHSDVVMGLVSVNSESLHNRLRFLQNCKY